MKKLLALLLALLLLWKFYLADKVNKKTGWKTIRRPDWEIK